MLKCFYTPGSHAAAQKPCYEDPGGTEGMPKITRADVADFMLLQLNDNTYLKKAAVLMS